MKEQGLFYLDGSFKTPEQMRPNGNGAQPNIQESLLDIFDYKTPTTPEEAAEKLGVGVDLIGEIAGDLMADGYGLVKTNDGYLKTKTVNPETSTHDETAMGRHLHFGLVSDSHLSSKKERLDRLEQMYDIFQREGVGTVYHVGDITEGYGVYKGQEFEISKLGQEEQIDYAVAVYPHREGITTKFITGNHDLRQYEKGGVDPGYAIARRRDDMVYLGPMTANVEFRNQVKMELLHPAGNVAYALSYKAQRDINNRHPQDLPSILAYGHYHTSFYMFYRNIHFFQVPCFKDGGLWEKRLGLNPTIGAWLVDATIGDHALDNIKPELFTFNGTLA